MLSKRVLILETSEIIVEGLKAVLSDIEVITVDLYSLSTYYGKCSMVLINPSVPSISEDFLKHLREEATKFNFNILAIVYAYFDSSFLSLFDDIIYINDNPSKIHEKLISQSGHLNKTCEETASLSQRENDVIRLVAIGRSNKEIAEELFISVHTVISHRKNISSKLGIKSASGLTIYAVINKLISPKDYEKK